MRKVVLLILLFSTSFICFSQDVFDVGIRKIEIFFSQTNWDDSLDLYYANNLGERLIADSVIIDGEVDQDDGINCQDENEGLCEGGDEISDVWDSWNILLRDFVILDRHGIEFARINLTYNNPDPTELGECSGNYQKIKDLILAARNR